MSLEVKITRAPLLDLLHFRALSHNYEIAHSLNLTPKRHNVQFLDDEQIWNPSHVFLNAWMKLIQNFEDSSPSCCPI